MLNQGTSYSVRLYSVPFDQGKAKAEVNRGPAVGSLSPRVDSQPTKEILNEPLGTWLDHMALDPAAESTILLRKPCHKMAALEHALSFVA